MQCIVLACLLGLATFGLGVASAGWAVGLLALASLASATQDIATDGMAAEHFSGELLAKVNAVQIAGVMIGFFGGGAGSLILAGHFGQRTAFLVMACVPLASLCCVLALGRGDPTNSPAPAAKASLLRFLRRPLAPSLLALALLSAMTAVSGFGLSKLYLSDAGWALQDIGRLGMSGGLVTVFLGCGGGAWLVRRIGLWRGFALGVVLAGCSALLWYLQAGRWLALSEGLAWTCVLIGSLATGITSVAILTAAMRFAGQGGQAGTDVTAVQSTRPRRDAGVFVPGQPHRADRLCRRFPHRQRPGGAGLLLALRLQAARGAGVEGAGGRPEALPIGAQRPRTDAASPADGRGGEGGAVACPVLLAWPFHLVAVAAGDRFQRRALLGLRSRSRGPFLFSRSRLARMILLAVGRRASSYSRRAAATSALRAGGQLDAVEDRLRSAVGAHRIHQVGGVAEQRDASPAPVRQRIAVDHRVLQDQLVAGQQVADVEPAQVPVGEERQHVFQASVAVPVGLVVELADGGARHHAHPVHQRLAFGRVAPDRIATRRDQCSSLATIMVLPSRKSNSVTPRPW